MDLNIWVKRSPGVVD